MMFLMLAMGCGEIEQGSEGGDVYVSAATVECGDTSYQWTLDAPSGAVAGRLVHCFTAKEGGPLEAYGSVCTDAPAVWLGTYDGIYIRCDSLGDAEWAEVWWTVQP